MLANVDQQVVEEQRADKSQDNDAEKNKTGVGRTDPGGPGERTGGIKSVISGGAVFVDVRNGQKRTGIWLQKRELVQNEEAEDDYGADF